MKERRIKALATITGNYVNQYNQAQMLGGVDKIMERRARGDAAKLKFDRTGVVREPFLLA